MTGGQLQGLEAAACALSQQCGWWHSTEEGFTGPGIRESSSTSLGKVFRGCVEMCTQSNETKKCFCVQFLQIPQVKKTGLQILYTMQL